MVHRHPLRPVVVLTLAWALLPSPYAHAGAHRSRPVRTGQTACWDSAGNSISCAGTGQDGELRRGDPRSYFDPGNGTIRDKRTSLSWEKLSNDGSIHDKDNTYDWDEAFAKIDDLNTAAFAGFTDWRLPNETELETILNRGTYFPSVSAEFNTACPNGCTVLTCSCTLSAIDEIAWSSTTYVKTPSSAWLVNFYDGTAYTDPKTTAHHVRAVRGGS
ncbi:DUF1566 domain-containing protein [Candidatus Binatia bacterium]|jgi:hypothetical protein|nr:DUF1566 domain-containing protein [Candidatus Binatia bacterium]